MLMLVVGRYWHLPGLLQIDAAPGLLAEHGSLDSLYRIIYALFLGTPPSLL